MNEPIDEVGGRERSALLDLHPRQPRLERAALMALVALGGALSFTLEVDGRTIQNNAPSDASGAAALFQLMQVRIGVVDGAATQIVMIFTSIAYMPGPKRCRM